MEFSVEAREYSVEFMVRVCSTGDLGKVEGGTVQCTCFLRGKLCRLAGTEQRMLQINQTS
jgi:hypothetical protein